MTVGVERVDLGREADPLAVSLHQGTSPATDLLPALPRDARAWSRALPPEVEHRRALADLLAPRQEALGAGAAARANAEALAKPGTFVVAAGQQPGLLGGPLLALHKAAAVLHLARRLESETGRRVVPVFWSASDDHDLDEVRWTAVLARSGQVHRIGFPGAADGRSVRDLSLPEETSRALLRTLADLLPATERGAEALAIAERPSGSDAAEWSIACLLRCLGETGLVVVEPHVLAPLAGPCLAEWIRKAGDINASVKEAGVELGRRGLSAPLDPDPEKAPVFLREESGGPRRRIAASGSERAAALTLRRPELASADVVGRVLLQNRLLPVLAFVAGPTEALYWAQTRPAHRLLGVPFPVVVPRPQATWIDARAAATAAAFGLTLAQVLRGAEPPATAEDPTLDGALEGVRESLEALLGQAKEVLERGGEAAAALRRGVERLRREWAEVEAAARSGAEKDRGVGRGRWVRLVETVRPLGRPQERVLSPLSIVARHGATALRAGLGHLDPLVPGHVVLRLGETP